MFVSNNPNKYPNDDERGMISYIESTTIGIQINYSSRFVNPNGEILPCTLTLPILDTKNYKKVNFFIF